VACPTSISDDLIISHYLFFWAEIKYPQIKKTDMSPFAVFFDIAR